MVNEAVWCPHVSHCAFWIKFAPSVTPTCPLLCGNSKDLAFKGLSLRLHSQASTLNGIQLSCDINPQDENSICIYLNEMCYLQSQPGQLEPAHGVQDKE